MLWLRARYAQALVRVYAVVHSFELINMEFPVDLQHAIEDTQVRFAPRPCLPASLAWQLHALLACLARCFLQCVFGLRSAKARPA